MDFNSHARVDHGFLVLLDSLLAPLSSSRLILVLIRAVLYRISLNHC